MQDIETLENETMLNLADNAVAMVRGQPLASMPLDLFIPPDALEVFLDAFTGPLDLLLYLIKRQNFDILDIPVAEITRQYISYISMMKELRLDVAAEYLVMAAWLAEIKSRLLLPKPPTLEGEEADPRLELARRLQDYERLKLAAQALDELPRQGRDIFLASVQVPPMPQEIVRPKLDLRELALAFQDILKRAELVTNHRVPRESLSIRERMTQVLTVIKHDQDTDFITLFSIHEGKMGVVVTFIAILELLKQSMIEMSQTELFGTIYVRAKSGETAELSLESVAHA